MIDRSRLNLGLLLIGMVVASAAAAQDYPAKGVRVVVPSAAGGPIDIAARVIGQYLSERWKQPVTVENRAGASEILGTEAVARAAPDGYTLLITSTNPFAINPVVFPKLSYDPERGFAPVALITRNPMVFVAGPKASFSTLKELISQAKARPGEMQWSSPGLATTNHITGEWFASEAGISLFHVPYKGGPAASNAIVAGDVQFGIVSLINALPLAKTTGPRIIAVTTSRRTPLAPDWPTVAELSLPGFDAAVQSAMFAPAGTPPSVIAKLNADVNRALQLPDTRDRFAALGVEPVGSTPEELAAIVANLRAKIKEIVERAQIKVVQ
jgi:tripartite-type tricarboxylate transporter receptor subunit TctC